MADIFISYASDDRPKAVLIAKVLEKQGWSVFWDRTILPGKKFEWEIQEQISQAKCVVVLWSQKSILSDWVKDEANEGNKRGILVPAIIDSIEPPLGFRSIQAADLINWDNQTNHSGILSLINAISQVAGSPAENDSSNFSIATEKGETIRTASGRLSTFEKKSNIADLLFHF